MDVFNFHTALNKASTVRIVTRRALPNFELLDSGNGFPVINWRRWIQWFQQFCPESHFELCQFALLFCLEHRESDL